MILSKEELNSRKVNSEHSVMLDGSSPEKKEKFEIPMKRNWEGTESFARNAEKIETAQKKLKLANFKMNSGAAYQLPSDLYDFVDALRIDITRRAMASGDYTSEIATEIVNPAFSLSVTQQEFRKYIAPFKEFDGNGEQVGVLQPNTGAKDTVTMKNYGVGWAGRTLNSLLYDSLFNVLRVNESIAEFSALRRNEQTIGVICDATYDASQIQAADATGSTLDAKTHLTISNAIDTLAGLLNPQDLNENIDTSNLMMICNPANVRQISRAINGNLTNGATVQNIGPLSEIKTVIPYSSKTHPYGKETITYTGCAKGYAYLFVPKEAFYVLAKRGLTTQTGAGDALAFTTEVTGWYLTQGEYSKEFLGKTGGCADGTGYVVKITLPSPQ